MVGFQRTSKSTSSGRVLYTRRGMLRFTVALGVMLPISLANAEPEKAKPEEEAQIVLQVAVILKEAGPMLSFTVVNNSPQELDIVGPGASPSPIVLITPDGKEIMKHAELDYEPGFRPSIKPQSTQTWRVSASDIFDDTRLTAPGTYRIFWRYYHWIGGKQVIESSNEILILREELPSRTAHE